MTGLFQDFRCAVRQLRRSPGFTAIAIATLALGIGANTAIFSVINAVLLQPLPYRDSGALFKIAGKNPKKGIDVDLISPADFNDLQNQSRSFAEMGYSTDQVYNLTNAGDPESLLGYQLSANFFNVLGVDPMLGRTFSSGEDTPGREHVVVLSHRLWQRRFAGNAEIVGKTITLNTHPYVVIGVMPANFYYPVRDNELWTPLAIPPSALNDRSTRFLRVLARFKPSITLAQAQTEINTIAARIAAQHPDTNAGQGAQAVSIQGEATRDIRDALLSLMGAVGFVLLIACTNVANLLLARAARRRGEVALRTALGASRLRLAQQALVGSILLGLAGGMLGVLLATPCVNSLVRMFPPTISNLNIPRVEHIEVDGRVLVFALLVSVLTGVLFGVAPALLRVNVRESLQGTSRGMRTLRGGAFRNALVISEIALSLILLVGAGLLIKSFVGLLGRKLGFTSEGVLTFRVILPDSKYASETLQKNFVEQTLGKIRATPGVTSAGTVTFLPLSGWVSRRTFAIEGQATGNSQPRVVWSAASPDYFRTMEISRVRGRTFTESDSATAKPVLIVSQTTARRYWPNEDPIGAHVTLQYEKTPREVVGVVGDVRHFGVSSEAAAQIYVPYQQTGNSLICFVVRSGLTKPLDLEPTVREAVWAVDKDQPVSYAMSMDQLVSESLAPQRVLALLLGSFAGLALFLAVIGVYGVMVYVVVERTHEIGIRMALGAGRQEVLRLVVGRAMKLALAGVVIGIAGAWTVTRFLSTMLYGVQPADLQTFFVVPVLLGAATVVASYIPARRAAKVDPMVALRYE